MRYLLCGIAKNEQNYIQEWIDWHRGLGFDVVVYDNNDTNTPLHAITGTIEHIDWRGRTCCQQAAYNDCYKRYKSQYDWFAFLDIDEYLHTEKGLDEWLSGERYADFDGIKVNWRNFTDSGLVDIQNGDYGRARFTEVLSKDNPRNRYCKTIMRGGLRAVFKSSVHIAGNLNGRICDVHGRQERYSNTTYVTNWHVACIDHYRFRTITEYVTNKMQRLYPDQPDWQAKSKLTIDYFFTQNEWTQEKQDIAERLLND